jgi:hypothetical protein
MKKLKISIILTVLILFSVVFLGLNHNGFCQSPSGQQAASIENYLQSFWWVIDFSENKWLFYKTVQFRIEGGEYWVYNRTGSEKLGVWDLNSAGTKLYLFLQFFQATLDITGYTSNIIGYSGKETKYLNPVNMVYMWRSSRIPD